MKIPLHPAETATLGGQARLLENADELVGEFLHDLQVVLLRQEGEHTLGAHRLRVARWQDAILECALDLSLQAPLVLEPGDGQANDGLQELSEQQQPRRRVDVRQVGTITPPKPRTHFRRLQHSSDVAAGVREHGHARDGAPGRRRGNRRLRHGRPFTRGDIRSCLGRSSAGFARGGRARQRRSGGRGRNVGAAEIGGPLLLLLVLILVILLLHAIYRRPWAAGRQRRGRCRGECGGARRGAP
mmetsp:Transcript_77174/g.223334  ORF Transcript_77174/g.223334 Transcript_77174/m.223334 type:complete len:243 (-) Transcript_77174:1527-2255(-)